MAKQNSLPNNLPRGAQADGTIPKKKIFKLVRGLANDQTSSQFDRIIHDRIRLAILSSLAVNEKLTFKEMKQLLDVTDGNLSVHARKLEEAGYINVSKFFEGRMPKTEYQLTKAGQKALDAYLNHMEALIHAMRDQ